MCVWGGILTAGMQVENIGTHPRFRAENFLVYTLKRVAEYGWNLGVIGRLTNPLILCRHL